MVLEKTRDSSAFFEFWLTISFSNLIMNGRNIGKENAMGEIVLYHAPRQMAHASLLKGVLVQMEVRIRNLTPGRCGKKIGFLVGMEGYEDSSETDSSQGIEGTEQQAAAQFASMTEELLVLSGFTDERLDELLDRLRRAGVPKIKLKAIVTETNADWTVYELYHQLQIESSYEG